MHAVIPEITVTMLGHSKSGKTTFMIGMYNMLLSGLTDYMLYATDADQDLELIAQWEKLCESSELPKATTEVPQYYNFVFTRGLKRLLKIDWMDYRGGTLLDETSGADAKRDAVELHARLTRSDCIYAVLDGGLLGDFLASRNPADLMKLRASRMSSLIHRTLDQRPVGRPLPSFVVLITKADLIAKRTGKPAPDVMPEAVKAVQRLLTPVFDPQVTTLICPVRIGRISEEDYDRYEIAPQWVEKPFIFSLYNYLTEQIADDQQLIGRLADRDAEAAAQLSKLRGSFLGAFRAGKDRELAGAADAAKRAYGEKQTALRTNQNEAERLAAELDDVPIVRHGKLSF